MLFVQFDADGAVFKKVPGVNWFPSGHAIGHSKVIRLHAVRVNSFFLVWLNLMSRLPAIFKTDRTDSIQQSRTAGIPSTIQNYHFR